MKKIMMVFLLLLLLTWVFMAEAATVLNKPVPAGGEWDFKMKTLWECSGTGEEVFGRIVQFLLDEEENVYIMDSKHNRIFVFDPHGKFRFAFGKKGEGPGEFKHGLNFYIAGAYVVVLDMDRLVYYNLKGEYIKDVKFNQAYTYIPVFFMDENRFVYTPKKPMQAAGTSTIMLYDVNTLQSRPIVKLPQAQQEETKIAGVRGGTIVTVSNTGLIQNVGLVVGRYGDKLLWGKNDRYTIQAVDPEGREQFSFSLERSERKKISREYKERFVSGIRLNNRPVPREIAENFIKSIPDESTFFFDIAGGKDGLIYVFVSDRARSDGQEIDIFSPAGRYLYHADIKVPDGCRLRLPIVRIKKDKLYLVMEDAEGELKLVKYTVTEPGNMSD